MCKKYTDVCVWGGGRGEREREVGGGEPGGM